MIQCTLSPHYVHTARRQVKAALASEMAEAGGAEVAALERRIEMLARQAAASMDFVGEAAKQTAQDVAMWIKSRFQVGFLCAL